MVNSSAINKRLFVGLCGAIGIVMVDVEPTFFVEWQITNRCEFIDLTIDNP